MVFEPAGADMLAILLSACMTPSFFLHLFFCFVFFAHFLLKKKNPMTRYHQICSNDKSGVVCLYSLCVKAGRV